MTTDDAPKLPVRAMGLPPADSGSATGAPLADRYLAEIVGVWERLPRMIKGGIPAMVRASNHWL